MRLKRLVFAILPLLLLSSCSSTGSSSSPVEENKATEKERAEANLKKDDLSQVKVYEYRYEGDSFYYRSIVWNGKKKAPSLFLALTEEDKTDKNNYGLRIGGVDTSFYYFYIPRKTSDSEPYPILGPTRKLGGDGQASLAIGRERIGYDDTHEGREDKVCEGIQRR